MADYVREVVCKNDDALYFAYLSGKVRAAANELLEEMFGPRCPYVESECGCNCHECCKRWRLLDDLLENPFKE
jgi:hypothetical protein